jgi:hypothetical protein
MIEALRSASEALTYLWNNLGEADDDDEEDDDGNIVLMVNEDKHAEAFMALLNDAREKLAVVLDKIDHVPG